MDLQEKQQYKIEPEAFWEAGRMVDGYDRVDLAARAGKPPWIAVASWGRDGWDLGQWPYVVFYLREVDGAFQYATNVEGDVYVWSFPTEEMRNRAIDAEALWYWQHEGRDWVQRREGKEPYTVDNMPDKLRGPFSWARCEREREVTQMVTNRAELDALPIGSILRDRHGELLRKTGESEFEDQRSGDTYDTDEILGTYAGVESPFLPAEVIA